MTEFFRNFPRLRAGAGPRKSTGIDSIPPILDTIWTLFADRDHPVGNPMVVYVRQLRWKKPDDAS